MKALYLFLMFSTSSLIGLYYGYLMNERENTLVELNNFLKYMVIKISAKSGKRVKIVRPYPGGVKFFDGSRIWRGSRPYRGERVGQKHVFVLACRGVKKRWRNV